MQTESRLTIRSGGYFFCEVEGAGDFISGIGVIGVIGLWVSPHPITLILLITPIYYKRNIHKKKQTTLADGLLSVYPLGRI